MRGYRPANLPPETNVSYERAEFLRRDKWLYRQRCKDPRTPLTIHDAPPRRIDRTSTEREWLDPCPECGRYMWDLEEGTAERYCAPCRGVKLTQSERRLCYELRRRRAS